MSTTERSQTHVSLAKVDSVATIRFDADEGIPIISSRVLGELGTIVEQIAEDGNTRFVVLRGSGNVFLAGADVSEMAHFTEDEGQMLARHGQHVFDLISTLPQATIAAINGHAVGGGLELALACDFRIMVRGGTVGMPESRLGLIPGWGGTQRLPKVIGDARARRMLFTGEKVKAEEAERIGLVDQVVKSEQELNEALQSWFHDLAAGSPAAVARIKRAMADQDEENQFALCFSCSDAKEGVRAFLEKRPPLWTPWAESGKTGVFVE